jgi:hypothetical protein
MPAAKVLHHLPGNLQNSVTVQHATPPPPNRASKAAQLVLILRRFVLLVLALPAGSDAAAAASCDKRSAALTAPEVRRIAGNVHSTAQDVTQHIQISCTGCSTFAAWHL